MSLYSIAFLVDAIQPMKGVSMILIWIFVIAILFLFAFDQLVERMYRYEKKSALITPKKYDIPFDEVLIPAKDGGQLHAWWIPARQNAPTLILIHGWSRNRSRVMPYIRALHPLGYNLLAFDARNHGDSSPIPHPTVGTFSEDALSALDFISRSDQISTQAVGILGLSIGGGAAINSAGWDKRVKCVVTIGALSHPKEVMSVEFQKRKIPNSFAAFLLKYIRLRFGIDFDKIAPVNNIRSAEADIFLIHGDKDETIPLAQGQSLAAANPKKSQLWVVPDKGHSDCDTHPQFWEKVGAFLQATLPIPK
jgi:pimeloyl-ACP methyl ester carboxylesterase